MRLKNTKLISEVIGRETNEVHLNGNILEIYPKEGIARSTINKYEFIHMIIEWAYKKRHAMISTENKRIWSDLSKTSYEDKYLASAYDYAVRPANVETFIGDEFTSVIDAGEWILENQK